jgi:predicted ATP-grasp superfamily ATP-dependent carboligase
MELVERAYGLSGFEIHATACETGTLPEFSVVGARRAARGAVGRAVVFARHRVVAGHARQWIADAAVEGRDRLRDIPRPGTLLRPGRPVCTVFAEAPDAATCYARLVECAARVYADLDAWRASPHAR